MKIKLTDYDNTTLLFVTVKRFLSFWYLLTYFFYIFGYLFMPKYFIVEMVFYIGIIQPILYESYKSMVAKFGVKLTEDKKLIVRIFFDLSQPINDLSLLYVSSEKVYYLIYNGAVSVTAQPLLFKDKQEELNTILLLNKKIGFKERVTSRWLISFMKGNYKTGVPLDC